jgi:hypothetical protein
MPPVPIANVEEHRSAREEFPLIADADAVAEL